MPTYIDSNNDVTVTNAKDGDADTSTSNPITDAAEANWTSSGRAEVGTSSAVLGSSSAYAEAWHDFRADLPHGTPSEPVGTAEVTIEGSYRASVTSVLWAGELELEAFWGTHVSTLSDEEILSEGGFAEGRTFSGDFSVSFTSEVIEWNQTYIAGIRADASINSTSNGGAIDVLPKDNFWDRDMHFEFDSISIEWND